MAGLQQGFVGKPAQGFEQHDELIAAESGDGVAFADTGQQAGGGLPQQQVTHVMTQGVIEQLELVQIQKQHSAKFTGTLRGQRALRQPIHQEPAVGQAGQYVLHGH